MSDKKENKENKENEKKVKKKHWLKEWWAEIALSLGVVLILSLWLGFVFSRASTKRKEPTKPRTSIIEPVSNHKEAVKESLSQNKNKQSLSMPKPGQSLTEWVNENQIEPTPQPKPKPKPKKKHIAKPGKKVVEDTSVPPLPTLLPMRYPHPKKKPTPPRKPFKKTRTDNARAYAGKGFSITTKLECNNCKKACWHTEGDTGGITCLGFSLNHNPDLLAHILSGQFKQCKSLGIMFDKSDPFGKRKDVCYYLRHAYFNRYVKKYVKCPYKAMMHISDTAILQGHKQAVKILQRAGGIKIDGKFGPQSLKACKSLNLDKFVNERIKALKSYRQFPKFGKGWVARVHRLKELLK